MALPLRFLCLVLAGCACLACAAHAVEESDVLFFAPYEDAVDAQLSSGSPTAKATGSPRFAPGKRGKAAALDAESLLTYAFKGNVVPDEGTIMMWFKPEWDAADDKFHNLFAARTGNFGGKALNAIILYKYARWARLSLYTSNGQKTRPQEGRSMAFRNELSWKAGEWVHVAGTWSATVASTEMLLYLNGERIAACGGAVFLPERVPDTFSIGGPEGSGTTWFDDVLVFSRPLLPQEVKGIYDAYKADAMAPPDALPFQSSRELQLRAHVLFAQEKLVAHIGFRGARAELAGRPGRVDVTVSRNGKTFTAHGEAGETGAVTTTFDYGEVGPGKVTIAATLRDHEGKVLRTGRLVYDVPKRPEWVGNNLGKTDTVPAPWTPVRATDRTVEVWGRRYVFDPSPLPSSISSQNSPLLRAPIRLSIRSLGREATLKMQPLGDRKSTDTVDTRTWHGTLGPLRCTAESRTEFDGFMLLNLTLRPANGAAVDALTLTVPLREDAASLFHHCNGTWSALSDAGGIGPVGWTKTLPFVPYVWVGNEKRGLAWFCESNHSWRNPDEQRAIELKRTAEGVDLVVRFVDCRAPCADPMRLVFGFMATPVKPMPDGWRNWRPMFTSALNLDKFSAERWAPADCRHISILWNTHVGSFSYLPADPPQMRQKVAVLRRNGWDTVVSYYALNQTQTNTPTYAVLEREWRRDPYGEQTFRLGSYSTVCAASTWADFLLWAIDKTMDETGTDGVYLDCSNPRFCKSAEHGCAPGRHTLLATRDLYKRIYALVRSKRGAKGFVYAHNSENHFITSYSFTDAVVNGEQYNRKDLRTLTFAKVRAEFCPEQYGVPTFLLPTLTKFQAKKREKMPGPEFLAFPLLHDVICLPQYLNADSRKLLLRIHRAMHDFGVADAEFLPYWDNADLLSCSPDGVRVSGYLRRDGKALLLIAQGLEQPTTCTVQLKGRLAGLQGKPARDPIGDRSLKWGADRLLLPLPGKAVQIAIVGPQG